MDINLIIILSIAIAILAFALVIETICLIILYRAKKASDLELSWYMRRWK